MRESKIEKYLADQIKLLGGTCEKFTTPNRRGPPDRLVCWKKDALWLCKWDEYASQRAEFIETKALGGKLTVLQQRDHARRRAMGFTVHVIWDMPGAETYLRSRGKK